MHTRQLKERQHFFPNILSFRFFIDPYHIICSLTTPRKQVIKITISVSVFLKILLFKKSLPVFFKKVIHPCKTHNTHKYLPLQKIQIISTYIKSEKSLDLLPRFFYRYVNSFFKRKKLSQKQYTYYFATCIPNSPQTAFQLIIEQDGHNNLFTWTYWWTFWLVSHFFI